MIKSVRSRLAFRFSLLFGLLAVVIAFATYLYLEHDAYTRLDAVTGSLLKVTGLALQHEIEEHGGKAEGEKSLHDLIQTIYDKSFPQEQIAIWDKGRLIAYKKNLGRDQGNLRAVDLSGKEGMLNALDLRIATATVYVPLVGTTYRVAVSTWRGDTQNDLAALSYALSIIVSLAFLLLVAGAYLLALRTLRPLAEIASEIDSVTSRNLAKRISITSSHSEIQSLAAGFNRLLERLQKTFEQQQQFMADASHALKTPVSASLTAAQVMLKISDRSPAEYCEALQVVERQMLQLRRIVQDMFLLARADTDSLPVRKEEFYLDELVAEAVRSMRILAERSGVTLTVDTPLPETPSLGDPDLLRQLITILLDNACRYNRAAGSIRVSLTTSGDVGVLRVIDTGPGIPVSARPHLFDRFFRGDCSRSQNNGTNPDQIPGAGLGLAIAKWIAEQHSATLTLEQSSSEGSTFALHMHIGDSVAAH